MRIEKLPGGGWLDAIARDPRYRSPRRVFQPFDEYALADEIAGRLQAIVDGGFEQIVAPLGIGGHVDHQIAHAAVQKLTRVERIFYEDTPYVLTCHQLPRRLHRLGFRALPSSDPTLARSGRWSELAATARAWNRSPFVRGETSPLSRPFAVATIVWPDRRSPAIPSPDAPVAQSEWISDSHHAKLSAIATYQSQWPLFFPKLEDWKSELAEYARAQGYTELGERRWRLPR